MKKSNQSVKRVNESSQNSDEDGESEESSDGSNEKTSIQNKSQSEFGGVSVNKLTISQPQES